MSDPMYRIAREVMDEVMGEGAYAEHNKGNPDPSIQAEIRAWAEGVHEVRTEGTSPKLYRLTYQPAPGWDETAWEKTADQLLVPNGTVPLIVWMYQTAAERGLTIRLEEM
jgi:hypothetical protein